jgi:putative tryptophan/tyrosine transport system substrate-binding protein
LDFSAAARPANPPTWSKVAFRWAEGRYDRLPALAANLVDLRVAVLFAAGGQPSALAAKAATANIPVVFSAVNDPVELGLVDSLSHPGGNVTGMSTVGSGLRATGNDERHPVRPYRAIASEMQQNACS